MYLGKDETCYYVKCDLEYDDELGFTKNLQMEAMAKSNFLFGVKSNLAPNSRFYYLTSTTITVYHCCLLMP